MSPRKRARPNPGDASESSSSLPLPTPTPAKQPLRSSSSSAAAASSADLLRRPTPAPEGRGGDVPDKASATVKQASQLSADKQVKKTRSWYGSWPRGARAKSAPSTQVARESIFGGTLKPDRTLDLSRYDAQKGSAEMLGTVTASDATSALPLIDEISPDTASTAPSEQTPSTRNQQTDNTSDTPENVASVLPPSGTASELPQRPATSSGWLGWISRPVVTAAATARAESPLPETPNADDKPEQNTNEPQRELGLRDDSGSRDAHNESAETTTTPTPPAPLSDLPASSWFGFWTARTPSKPRQPADGEAALQDEAPDAKANTGSAPQPKEEDDVVMQDAAQDASQVTSPQTQPAGSTWAFWSKDTKNKSRGADASSRVTGEIAVIGEGSEGRPQPASTSEADNGSPALRGPTVKSPTPASAKDTYKKSKRLRPQSMDNGEPGARPGTPASAASVAVDTASQKSGASRPDSPAKNSAANLLLPSFRSTYRMRESPSILWQIKQFLLRTQQPPVPNHVFLAREPPKIKRALAIGVHGLFPAAYLRPMIGQPTGTSIRFANHCADSIRSWADNHGCEGCEIEKVALEGEGKIADRVENLWKLLLNWIDLVRKADLIMVACHSQGVPVGIMLVAKLIGLGIITTPRIGVCAMAGVSLGPFPSYQSGLLMGSAAELWEFANPDSEVSKRYESSLKTVLDYGVRVTYIGSIDDQVVPLESALYSSASHPLIYRAVFVDSRLHAPDFIAHLVGFALKLRNMGISDHGLIRELSVPLAGSLYSGAGHSTLYDDPQVYDLAMSHALETSDVGRVPCEIKKHEGITNANPYHLPWIMRGLLEEDLVKTELSSEVTELLTQFDKWKPTTKALKDVKYRLEAVRSKL